MLSRIEKLCIDKGLKMTGQRRVIAQVLSAAEDHPDAEELHRRACAIDDKISMATVYRTVRLFEEAQILERHDFGDGRARYETAEDGDSHHHHIINMRTGEVIEFEDAALEALKQKIASDLGYEIVGERLELYCVPRDDDEGAER
ncbi:MAG: Fur family transcriptional regulator [Pseudomonadota bacterium]|nr:Fur family transcriptional regulator [Pseudomonadota bacterium]